MATGHYRPATGPFDTPDPSGRQTACLTQGCAWKQLSRLETQGEGLTPIGRLLHDYYLDLAERCDCPQGRGGRPP